MHEELDTHHTFLGTHRQYAYVYVICNMYVHVGRQGKTRDILRRFRTKNERYPPDPTRWCTIRHDAATLTPKMAAVASPSDVMTPELVIPSMDVNSMEPDERVFALAAYGGARELKELLDTIPDAGERRALCNLADPETGTTPLILGIRRDNSSVALALIEGGADVHQANHAGWTPSSVATQFASPKVVQMLASCAPTDEGSTKTR